MAREYASHVEEIAAILKRKYGDPSHHNPRNPLQDLFFVICSIQTNEVSYRETYRLFRNRSIYFQQCCWNPETVSLLFLPMQ